VGEAETLESQVLFGYGLAIRRAGGNMLEKERDKKDRHSEREIDRTRAIPGCRT